MTDSKEAITLVNVYVIAVELLHGTVSLQIDIESLHDLQ